MSNDTSTSASEPDDPIDLSDLTITYDLRKLKAEAEKEFEVQINTRELLEQNAISRFFDLGGKSHEGN